jgi:hypothetical protein
MGFSGGKEGIMDEISSFGVKIVEMEVAFGLRGLVRVRYYDWSAMMAHFPVPAAKVRELPPSDKLKPALLTPGTPVVAFGAYEYREVADVPPHNEFGITVPVKYEPAVNIPVPPLLSPHWLTRLWYFVHHLPATEEVARDGGIEGWGHPKFSFKSLGLHVVGRSRVLRRAITARVRSCVLASK